MRRVLPKTEVHREPYGAHTVRYTQGGYREAYREVYPTYIGGYREAYREVYPGVYTPQGGI